MLVGLKTVHIPLDLFVLCCWRYGVPRALPISWNGLNRNACFLNRNRSRAEYIYKQNSNHTGSHSECRMRGTSPSRFPNNSDVQLQVLAICALCILRTISKSRGLCGCWACGGVRCWLSWNKTILSRIHKWEWVLFWFNIWKSTICRKHTLNDKTY